MSGSKFDPFRPGRKAPKITSEQIAEQTEQFVADGGKIEIIEPGVCRGFERVDPDSPESETLSKQIGAW